MVLVKLVGRDGSVWHLTAGPSGHRGVRLNRRRRMPDCLDRLLAWAASWLATLAGMGRWP